MVRPRQTPTGWRWAISWRWPMLTVMPIPTHWAIGWETPTQTPTPTAIPTLTPTRTTGMVMLIPRPRLRLTPMRWETNWPTRSLMATGWR